MKTKLFNNEGKQLYTKLENIQKASKRRRDRVWGKIINYTPGYTSYIIQPIREIKS